MRDNVMELLQENSKRKKPKRIEIRLRSDMEISNVLDSPEMKIALQLANGVSFMDQVDPWNGMITQEMLSGTLRLQNKPVPYSSRPCMQLFNIAVHPNGDIHACPCRNMGQDPDLHLGNIMEVDINSAFQRLNGIFEKWENEKIPSVCKNCFMYADPANGIFGLIKNNL